MADALDDVVSKLGGLSARKSGQGVVVNVKGKWYKLLYENGKLLLPLIRKPAEDHGFKFVNGKFVAIDVDEIKVKEAIDRFGVLYEGGFFVVVTNYERSPNGLKSAMRLVKLSNILSVSVVMFIIFGILSLIFYIMYVSILNLIFTSSIVLVVFGVVLFFVIFGRFWQLKRIWNSRKFSVSWPNAYYEGRIIPKDADITLLSGRPSFLRIRLDEKVIELPYAYALPLTVMGYIVKEKTYVPFRLINLPIEIKVWIDVIVNGLILLTLIISYTISFKK